MDILKEYSMNQIRYRKNTTVFIALTIYIACTLLSVTCGIFYNIWLDDVQQVRTKCGSWHGKITGNHSDHTLYEIRKHPNVEAVELTGNSSSQKAVFITLASPVSIYSVLPRIAQSVKAASQQQKDFLIEYNTPLLSRYFIFNSLGDIPPVLVVYLLTLLVACLTLILIIHNAFSVSFSSRIQQLGILKSVGASPSQVKRVLIHEAFLLSIIPLPAGIISGWGLCWLFNRLINTVARSVFDHEINFQYGLPMLIPALLASSLTIWISALIPAKKIARMSLLNALRYGIEPSAKKVRKHRILSRMTGIEGELAKKSMDERRKSFRISTITLTLSLILFSGFINMGTISQMSTKITYYDRYQNAWDIMITIPSYCISASGFWSELKRVSGISSITAYHKATAYTLVPSEMQSTELLEVGGLTRLQSSKNTENDTENLVLECPILSLDEECFNRYCTEIGVDNSLFYGGNNRNSIIVNTVWDSVNSNRRYKKMIPYLKLQPNTTFNLYPDSSVAGLESSGLLLNGVFSTDTPPVLKESFPNYSLIQIIPESTYTTLVGGLNGERNASAMNTYITVIAASEDKVPIIAQAVSDTCAKWFPDQNCTIENMLESKRKNERIYSALETVIWCLSGLLALIGIANVFSNVLGLLYQRYREFARLKSIGLSPAGLQKMLIWEAVLLGMYPICISLLINIPIILLGLNATLITPAEFLKQAPLPGLGLYTALIMAFIGLAYFLGSRKIMRTDKSILSYLSRQL